MHEIEVYCRSCHHYQLATRGKSGASVPCEKCSEAIIVPGLDQCLDCGQTIKLGSEVCASCERERNAAKSLGGRLKTVASGIAAGALGLWTGHTGVWHALETGVQHMSFGNGDRRSHDLHITREWDPFRFWGGVGFSAIFCVGLVLLALAMVVTGVLGKGQGRFRVDMSRFRIGRSLR